MSDKNEQTKTLPPQEQNRQPGVEAKMRPQPESGAGGIGLRASSWEKSL